MLCFLCGKEIGWLRTMVDRQYCSAEHRKDARLASANALRDEEDEQEIWSVAKTRQRLAGRSSPSNQSASIFAFLTLGALLVAMLMLPGNSGPRGSAFPSVSADQGTRQGLFERASGSIGEILRQSAPVTLHHDFRSGMADWTTAALKTATHIDDPHDWKIPTAPTLVAPGSHQRRRSGDFPVMRVVYVGGGLEGRSGPVGHTRAKVVMQCNRRALAQNFADRTGGPLKQTLSSPLIGRNRRESATARPGVARKHQHGH